MARLQFPEGSFERQVLDEMSELRRSLGACQGIHGVSGRPLYLQAPIVISGSAGGGIVGIGLVIAKFLGVL